MTAKNYVLDTNVLIYDPSSIRRFQNNNIYIPIYVLEEIDGLKNDMTGEKGRHAREIVRVIDDLRKQGNLSEGVPIGEDGKLYVYVPSFFKKEGRMEPTVHGLIDQLIMSTATEIRDKNKETKTVFVTMDINLRVRADAIGLLTEPYEFQSIEIDRLCNDVKEVIVPDSDIDEFYSRKELIVENIESDCPITSNDSVMLSNGSGKTALARYRDKKLRPLIVPREGIMGIRPRNKEQAFALDLLIDDNVKLITIMGQAGTGKTMLALAAGIRAVLEGEYSKLLISRPVIPLGRDLGALPGTVEEKLEPYMCPFYDNLDYIMMAGSVKKSYGTSYEDLFESGQVQVEPLTYIRGRSISNQFIIVDEAQNLTPHEIKTIISRCGENTKIVLTGDPHQIDNPYVDETSNGLSVTADKIRDENIAGHLKLIKGERSELANIAVEYL